MGLYTPDLKATNIIIEPASGEKVYDRERLEYLNITTNSEGKKISARIKFRNYRVLEDGSKEDHPSEQKEYYIKDLVAFALTTPVEINDPENPPPAPQLLLDLLNVMGSVEAVAKKIKDYNP